MQRNLRWLFYSTVLTTELFVSSGLRAQQDNPLQASEILNRSLGMMMDAGKPVRDITLSGTVEYIAGSTDEQGTIMMKATSDGSSRVDTSLPSGDTSESVIWSQAGFTGENKDAKGKLHSTSSQNLMTNSAWFSPVLLLQHFARHNSEDNVASAWIGETDGSSMEHLTWSLHSLNAKPGADKELQRLSRMDIFLDRETSLLDHLTYQSHSDRNSQINFRIEVRYSDYQATDGIQIPMHIQRYLNGVLSLDIHISSVVLNNGLAPTQFQLQ